jgi:hypothetical protein
MKKKYFFIKNYKNILKKEGIINKYVFKTFI